MMTSLWDRAITLEGQKLSTVERKKFTFKVATISRIDVTAEDGRHDPIRIYRREFDTAERKYMVFAGVRRGQLSKAGILKGPSYFAGIIQTLVERDLLP
jgi:hypothetical protein